jgi:hypothetical protein
MRRAEPGTLAEYAKESAPRRKKHGSTTRSGKPSAVSMTANPFSGYEHRIAAAVQAIKYPLTADKNGNRNSPKKVVDKKTAAR